MSKPILYIHVGPSKTATTFLQRDVLGRIESAECLPVPEIEVGGRRLRFGDLFSLSPEFWRGLEADPFADKVRHSGLRTPIKKERFLLRWPDFSRESEIRLTEALRAEILAAYEEGNRSLDERCSRLNLGEYGYY